MIRPVVRGAPVMGRALLQLRRLCPTQAAALRLWMIYLILVIRGRTARSDGEDREYRLRLSVDGNQRDWWVADSGEVTALWEVFIDEQYRGPLPERAGLIFDVGANIGAATLWLRSRYPAAQIVAVEPDPGTVKRLRRNVGGDPRVQVVQAALSDRDGELSFARDAWTMVGHVIDESAADSLTVSGLSLDSLRAMTAPDTPIDLLKLDVEGGEWRALIQPLTDVRTIVMETHEPTPNGRTPDELLEEVAVRDGFDLQRGAVPRVRWLIR